MTATCTVCVLHAESTFKIEGMDCREEVAMLERRFKHLTGLEDFSADVIGRRLHVKYDAAKLTAAAIADAVADTGMRAWLEHEEPVGTGEGQNGLRQMLVWTSAMALGLGLAADAAHLPAAAGIGWFIVSLAAGCGVTPRKTVAAVRVGPLRHNVVI